VYRPKKLCLHVNPKIEAEAPVSSLDRPHVDPVVECLDAPDGLTELKVRDSKGNRIGFFQVSARDLDNELCDDLMAWQARHAHAGASLSLG